MRPIRFAIPLAALLALSACDWFASTPQEVAGDARGEVLPASVSDEMIATQDLKSQPPALRVQPGEGGAVGAEGADSADAAAAGDTAAPAEDSAPAEAPATE